MNYRMRAITRGPKHHFFGYYDQMPWDIAGRYHLVLEVDFSDRPPTADDQATVGIVDLREADKFIPIAATKAWNFQQGSMLHWQPERPRTILFNDRRDGRFVCVACDIDAREQSVLGPAIGALSADGDWAATLPFERLAWCRPGYGYEGVPDRCRDVKLPDKIGLGLLNMLTGEHRLVAPIAALAPLQEPELHFGEQTTWFNHALFNPSGSKLVWLCRWGIPAKQWRTQMWMINADGSGIQRVLDGPLISHFDWKDDDTLIVWAGHKGVEAVWEIVTSNRHDDKPVLQGAIQQDGHICFSHDRRWVASDTYPDKHGVRRLFMVEYDTSLAQALGAYPSPMRREMPEIRCDFHPSWSDDDHHIAIDSIHEGSRQRYVVELEA